MNIQPSIVIWTVICFCLAMLILSKLLFGPLLRIMDQRKKMLSDAKAARDGRNKRYEDALTTAKETHDQSLADARVEAARLLDQARKEAEKITTEAEKASQAKYESYMKIINNESAEMKQKLDQTADVITHAYADKFRNLIASETLTK